MISRERRRDEKKEEHEGSSSSSVSSSSSSSSSSCSSSSSSSSSSESRASWTFSSSRSLPSAALDQGTDDGCRIRQQEEIVILPSASLLRRRPATNQRPAGGADNDTNRSVPADPVLRIKGKLSKGSDTKSKRRRRRKSSGESQGSGRRRQRTTSSRAVCAAADCCSAVSTVLVGTSLLVWAACVVMERAGESTSNPSGRFVRGVIHDGHQQDGRRSPFPPFANHPHATAQLRGREAPPRHSLRLPPPRHTFSALLSSLWEWIESIFSASASLSTSLPYDGGSRHRRSPPHGNNPREGQHKGDVEGLDPGCEHEGWQLESRPTCNRLHEIDFGAVIREWKQRLHHERQQRLAQARASNSSSSPFAAEAANASASRPPLGYLSDSGLWRTVWAVPDASDVVGAPAPRLPLVLKLMKHEHELDRRNLDRHRREALVMDRLTSSPYVANLYGFCGTTVLTEFLGQTLRDLLKESDEDEGRPSLAVGPSRGAGRSPAAPLGRSTPRGRLRLALHAARGVRALHESSVVHADVQEQQFLVGWSSSSESESDPQPRLVLNDFNRCRFLAHRVSGGTNESARKTRCPFRIPSAPGSSRAPEEYAFEDLTEQIDVYSLGNVLHQILTGEDPWGGWSVLEVTNQVQKGIKPVAPPEMLEHPSDVLLQNLTLRAYELDPEVRIRAKELVQQLEWAMSAYFGGE